MYIVTLGEKIVLKNANKRAGLKFSVKDLVASGGSNIVARLKELAVAFWCVNVS